MAAFPLPGIRVCDGRNIRLALRARHLVCQRIASGLSLARDSGGIRHGDRADHIYRGSGVRLTRSLAGKTEQWSMHS